MRTDTAKLPLNYRTLCPANAGNTVKLPLNYRTLCPVNADKHCKITSQLLDIMSC
jgi:hypothetical protein